MRFARIKIEILIYKLLSVDSNQPICVTFKNTGSVHETYILRIPLKQRHLGLGNSLKKRIDLRNFVLIIRRLIPAEPVEPGSVVINYVRAKSTCLQFSLLAVNGT